MEDNRTLSTARVLPYSPEAIFSAFASAPVLASWWGPEGFKNTFDAFDFTVGGKWIFTMHGPDGTNYANTSYFEALEPGKLVVIRHDCPPYFTLTVRLSKVNGGTNLTWDQVFDDTDTARAVKARVGSANEENLNRLTLALGRADSAA
jgi:uncharacterized protein YndB with AHSA1/START domain